MMDPVPSMALPAPLEFPAVFRFFLFMSEAKGGTPAAGSRSDPEEEGWVQAAGDGDPEAFRSLVDRYRDAAFSLALRIVQSREEAEDVAQEAFILAWRALPAFRREARFSTWLYRIVARRALAVAVSSRRRRRREEPLDAASPGELPDPAPPPAPIRDRLRLERLIARLSGEQRAAITLYYMHDRSVRDVAEILGMREGSVKTHLHRARAALRAAWLRETQREGNDELRGV